MGATGATRWHARHHTARPRPVTVHFLARAPPHSATPASHGPLSPSAGPGVPRSHGETLDGRSKMVLLTVPALSAETVPFRLRAQRQVKLVQATASRRLQHELDRNQLLA